MLTRVGRWAETWVSQRDPWTDVVGVARTLLAVGTLGTLLLTHSSSLFRPVVGLPASPLCEGSSALSLFCLVPAAHLEWARWASIAILAVVASGWRPDVTGLLHWWVSFSLTSSTVMVDGGDLVANNVSLLLLPVTLTDNRTWHWESPRTGDGPRVLSRFLALSAVGAIRVQLAVVYLDAFLGKMKVDEWADGTALYYWIGDPMFGAAYLAPLLRPFLLHGASVAALTWSVLLLEMILFAGLFMKQRYREWLLVAAILFHGGIAALMGLSSFAFAMWGALILYLWPVEQEFGARLVPARLQALARARSLAA